MILVAYAINNFVWVYITGKPVYPNIDWKTAKSYVINLVALVLLFVGYWLANYQYSKKSKSQSADETLNESQKVQYALYNDEGKGIEEFNV